MPDAQWSEVGEPDGERGIQVNVVFISNHWKPRRAVTYDGEYIRPDGQRVAVDDEDVGGTDGACAAVEHRAAADAP